MSEANYYAFPRPELGDKMHRFNLNGQYEEAQVNAIIGPEEEPDIWKAPLTTANGFEFVGSDREFRGRFDWVPHDWGFDELAKTWKPPGVEKDKLVLPTPEPGEHYMKWRKRVYSECPQLKSMPGGAMIISQKWEDRPVLKSDVKKTA